MEHVLDIEVMRQESLFVSAHGRGRALCVSAPP